MLDSADRCCKFRRYIMRSNSGLQVRFRKELLMVPKCISSNDLQPFCCWCWIFLTDNMQSDCSQSDEWVNKTFGCLCVSYFRALSTFAWFDATLLWIIQAGNWRQMQPTKTILLGCDQQSKMGCLEISRKHAQRGGHEEVCGRAQTGTWGMKVSHIYSYFD